MYNIKLEKLSTKDDRIDTFETVEINGTVKIDHEFEFISNCTDNAVARFCCSVACADC